MSGPKVTVYSLTAQQQRIITEQISCDQQSAACVGRIQELLKIVISLVIHVLEIKIFMIQIV